MALDKEGHPAQLPFPTFDIDRVLNRVSGIITSSNSTATAKQGEETTQSAADKAATSASSSESTVNSPKTRAHAEPVPTTGEGKSGLMMLPNFQSVESDCMKFPPVHLVTPIIHPA